MAICPWPRVAGKLHHCDSAILGRTLKQLMRVSKDATDQHSIKLCSLLLHIISIPSSVRSITWSFRTFRSSLGHFKTILAWLNVGDEQQIVEVDQATVNSGTTVCSRWDPSAGATSCMCSFQSHTNSYGTGRTLLPLTHWSPQSSLADEMRHSLLCLHPLG